MAYEGNWYGKDIAFGLHYDLHANPNDTDLGAHVKLEELVPDLGLMAPQWVQTDMKGGPGLTSWFSRTPTASVAPGLVSDALAGWANAARKLNIPIHGHYAGLDDEAAWDKHPDWRLVPNPRTPEKGRLHICPRSSYVDELMIPQLIEAVERYGLNGFWVDGEIAGYQFCYCQRCRDAFRQETGISQPPVETTDPNWLKWVAFHRKTFHDFVTHYIEAVRERCPNARICDNYLHTYRDPGEPVVPSDWLSGDVWEDLDEIRMEARFMATRGRPWDVMAWAFDKPRNADRSSEQVPWEIKSVARLEQEASVSLSLGGNFQIYETTNLRDGRLVPWRMERLGKVGDFFKERQKLCVGSNPFPHTVVLHSEFHLRSQPVTNLFWDYDLHGIRGAVFSLCEENLSVELADEWALRPMLERYPLVVAPEQDRMSDAMVRSLKEYVTDGGCLLLSGSAAYEQFGSDFLGSNSLGIDENKVYWVGAGDGSTPVFSKTWRKLEPITAQAAGSLGRTPLTRAEMLNFPPVTINQVGQGRVAYIPFDVFAAFSRTRYPMVRVFIGAVVRALRPPFSISVQGTPMLDVVTRVQENMVLVHLANRTEGVLSAANPLGNPPPVGPVIVTALTPRKPRGVHVLFQEGSSQYTESENADGGYTVKVAVPQVDIHATVVFEM